MGLKIKKMQTNLYLNLKKSERQVGHMFLSTLLCSISKEKLKIESQG